MIIHENDLIEEEIDGYRVLRKSESGGGQSKRGLFRKIVNRLAPGDGNAGDAPSEFRVAAESAPDEFCDVKLIHDGRCRCWLVDYNDKRYVLKLDRRDRHRFDYLAQSFFFGSNSFRLMRVLSEAFRQGFHGAPELLWVADKRRFGCTLHSFFFKEYVPGKTLLELPPEIRERCKDEALRIITTLHEFGTTHGDAHPGNFILDEDSGLLKTIDIGGKLPTAIQKATDRMRLEKEWGIPNELHDWGYALARLHVIRRHFLERLRRPFR